MAKEVNLKQDGLNFSRRLRRTPFTSSVEKYGVKGFSVVNHALLPKAFSRSIEEDYWHLRSAVQIWDVGVQRQVEIMGPDASKFVQYMTPRSLEKMKVGNCYYIPLIDENGGMVNDPVLLKHSETHYWLSIADSDVLLWAKGLAVGLKFNVSIKEPDVWPLAIQGPLAKDLLSEVFGDFINDIKFFKFSKIQFEGSTQIIARSGYSKQDGFEIYLQGFDLGERLWELLWEKGEKYNIAPGCPNLIDRIEAGLLSYGNEITLDTSPLEVGMEGFCNSDFSHDFVGKPALRELQEKGVIKKIKGIIFDVPPCPPCTQPWTLFNENKMKIGQITSAVFSPRIRKNIGLGLVNKPFWNNDTNVFIEIPKSKSLAKGIVSSLPFK
ncbi:MAG: dimethylsulfoniopropionate demethylase [Paracoccaceae bacterium]